MTIEEGKRAYTIRVDDVHGVGGFVLPADRVDILLTRDSQQSSDQRQRVADLLLQNVKVLAIDQEASDRVEGAKLAWIMHVRSFCATGTPCYQRVSHQVKVPIRTLLIHICRSRSYLTDWKLYLEADNVLI